MQQGLTVTKEQEDFIRKNHLRLTDEMLGKHLGLSKYKVYQNRMVMGLFRGKQPPPTFEKLKEEMFDDRKYRNFP